MLSILLLLFHYARFQTFPINSTSVYPYVWELTCVYPYICKLTCECISICMEAAECGMTSINTYIGTFYTFLRLPVSCDWNEWQRCLRRCSPRPAAGLCVPLAAKVQRYSEFPLNNLIWQYISFYTINGFWSNSCNNFENPSEL